MLYLLTLSIALPTKHRRQMNKIEYGALVELYLQGEIRYSEKNRFQCLFHHKSYIRWP